MYKLNTFRNAVVETQKLAGGWTKSPKSESKLAGGWTLGVGLLPKFGGGLDFRGWTPKSGNSEKGWTSRGWTLKVGLLFFRKRLDFKKVGL